MHSHCPVLISAVAAMLCAAPAGAATTITIVDGLDDPNAVQMAPGEVYSVWLVVQTNDAVTTIEGDLSCSAPHVVEVTSIAFASGWDQVGDLLALPPPGTLPASLATSLHLGSGRTNLDALTGSFVFATVTFQISETAQPGQYTLTFTNAELSGADYEPLTADQGPLYVISVVSDAAGTNDDEIDSGDPGTDEPGIDHPGSSTDAPPGGGSGPTPGPADPGDRDDSPATGGEPGTGGASPSNDTPPEQVAGGTGGPPPGLIGAGSGPAAGGCGAGLAQTAMMSAGMLLLMRRRHPLA